MSKPEETLGDVLDVVADRVPKLIRELLMSFYSEEAGAQMGKAVGVFYKELVGSGIPPEEALRMAKDYMETVKSIAMQHKG